MANRNARSSLLMQDYIFYKRLKMAEPRLIVNGARYFYFEIRTVFKNVL